MSASPAQHLQSLVGALENAVPPLQGWSADLSFLAELTPVRMRMVGRFWQTQTNASQQLGQALGRLVGGFSAATAPWGVLVQCNGGEIRFYWMVTGGSAGALTWAGMAAAALPGADWVVEDGMHSRPAVTDLNGHAAALLARHPCEADAAVCFSSDLSRLTVAMRGADWSLGLFARPFPPALVQENLSHLHRSMREMQRTWAAPGAGEDRLHPQVRHALGLLDAESKRYVEGSASGMWEMQACLVAEDATALAAGAMAWRGQLSAARLPLRSWNIEPCRLSADSAPSAISRLTTREAAALVPLPIEDTAGMSVRERVPFAQDGASAEGRVALAVGRVLADGRALSQWLELPLADLARHGLICGSTRSGKSQTAQFLLRGLWEEHGIPFLVLDPAKSDYRRLLRSPLGRDLRVFTPGLVGGARFTFNPLAVPPGVPVQMHMDGVRDLLLAAFGWVEPMPAVLSLALEVVYRAHGWNLNRGTHNPVPGHAKMPTIQNLIEVIPFVVEKLGWTGEAASLLRSGPATRLSSLLIGTRGSVLDTAEHIDIRSLLDRPTIIEMGWFGTDEDKAFLLGALVLALAEARLVDGACSELKHLLLIEEAHCLLAAPPSTGSSENAQPQQKAVRQFCNLLATIGGYGQGLIVVEQVPTKLAPDLLANTGLKIAHQLPLQQDCEAVGAAMTLTEAQRRFLPTLRRGEAVAFRAGDHGAFHIQVPDHAGKLGFSNLHISDAELATHMSRLHPLSQHAHTAR